MAGVFMSLFSYYKGRKHFASLSNINCQGWKLLPLPFVGSGWHTTKVQFKVETNNVVVPSSKQVNIQLGSGKGIEIFNEALIYFEKIN
jgi:hypothetical protein